MSYWVEIHCDVRALSKSTDEGLQVSCRTDANDNPASMGKTPALAASVARAIALQRKWINPHRHGKGGYQWVCPYCQSVPK